MVPCSGPRPKPRRVAEKAGPTKFFNTESSLFSDDWELRRKYAKIRNAWKRGAYEANSFRGGPGMRVFCYHVARFGPIFRSETSHVAPQASHGTENPWDACAETSHGCAAPSLFGPPATPKRRTAAASALTLCQMAHSPAPAFSPFSGAPSRCTGPRLSIVPGRIQSCPLLIVHSQLSIVSKIVTNPHKSPQIPMKSIHPFARYAPTFAFWKIHSVLPPCAKRR